MRALFRFESRVFCYTKKNLAILLAFILALSLFIPVLTGTLSLLLATGVNTLSAIISLFFLDYSFRLLFNGSDTFNRVWPLAAMYIKDVLQGYYAGTALNYTVLLGAFSVLLLLLGLTALALRNLEGGRV